MRTQEKKKEKKKDTSPSFLLPDEQEEYQLSKTKEGKNSSRLSGNVLPLKKFTLSDFESLKTIINFALPYKRGFLGGLFLVMLSSFATLFSARLMGELVEKGLLAQDLYQSYRFALYILLFSVFSFLTLWWGDRLITEKSGRTIYRIRLALFKHLQRLPIGFYDRQPQGRVVTRVTHDVEGIEEFFTGSMGRLLNSFFMAAMAVGAMLMTQFKLGLILLFSVIPSLVLIYATRHWVRRANRRLSRANGLLNAKLSEFLSGIHVIRSYGLEDWSKFQYDNHVDEYRQGHLAANKLYAWTRPLISFLCSFPLLFLIALGGEKVLSGAMEVGIFVTFVGYCDRFYRPIMNLAREVHVIQQAFTSIERVSSFLKHDGEEAYLGRDGQRILPRLEGLLQFDHLWMSYSHSLSPSYLSKETDGLLVKSSHSPRDEKWVLKDLNFSIQGGEKIGLVGATGCGKTTTVSLLSRLYEFQRGRILVDGVDIRQLSRNFLRKNIGFVSQDVILFRGTLRENLILDSKISDEEILSCCEMTGLAKVMVASAQKLDSQVFDKGENLSMGERQLISLTRALINNPAILILDEATANIDPWYESLIHKAVDVVMEKRTCLMIAHRLATLESCDRIFVFDEGRLVQQGKREDLYKDREGVFFKLHEAQGKLTDLIGAKEF